MRWAGQRRRQFRARIALRSVELGLDQEDTVAQVGAAEVGAPEIRAEEVGHPEVGVAQICADEVRAPQVGAAEVRAPESAPRSFLANRGPARIALSWQRSRPLPQ